MPDRRHSTLMENEYVTGVDGLDIEALYFDVYVSKYGHTTYGPGVPWPILPPPYRGYRIIVRPKGPPY